MIRLLICDDSDNARAALRTMLEEQGELEIVGEAADGEQAVALAVELVPDVVLVDVAMPVLDGVAATAQLRRLLPGLRIVAFAGASDREVVEAMLAAGADAYCVKGAPLWELERAIAGASDPLLRLAHSLARPAAAGVGALVARELHELTGAIAAVYLAEDDSLALAGSAGPVSREVLSTAPAAAARAFESRAPVPSDVATLADLERAGVRCSEAAGIPLVSDGVAFGSLLVAMPADVPLTIDHELVSAVADLAAAAIGSAHALRSTRAEARRDQLTGLPNRRAFDERLDELLALARPFEIALLDIDEFKSINDRFGHHEGDATLRELARVVQRSLRAAEDVYRIGGDELALLIEQGDATHVVERIREALHVHRRPRRLPTVSGGVASSPDDGSSRTRLLACADERLYAAKRGGKDRIAVTRAATGRRLPGTGAGASALLVDDDPALRALLRTTLEGIELDVREAESASSARAALTESVPDLLVLDVGLPDVDGLTLCRAIKDDARTAAVAVVILTGADAGTGDAAAAAGADAFLRKPFSPLELISVVERVLGRAVHQRPARASSRQGQQVQLYAEDLRRLLEVERGQRELIQRAYRQTVGALAAALESKDTGTGAHSQRVLRYASELARAVDRTLLDRPSVEYGFLLHDIGKIGIPDRILGKRGPLTPQERSLLETHTLLGEQMLAGVPLLESGGLEIVRSHHERWDGRGYPDRLSGSEIPVGARVFAVADTLDAMTSDRPYRAALPWDAAVAEIDAEASRQFDPGVVEAFHRCEPALRRIYYELATV